MQRDLRSSKKLIALVVTVGALAAATFVFMQDRKSSSDRLDFLATPSQDASVAAATVNTDPQSQPAIDEEIPDAAQLMDETAAPARTEALDYQKRVAEFNDAFAKGEPCRYIKVVNKIATPSLVGAFAKEPVGQSASASDTEMLKRLYSQGAFADKPSSAPTFSTRSEEFLMALRYAGLVDGVKRSAVDFSKSESQLRKIAARDPDNGAPLYFLSDVLASQKKDGRALMKEIFKTTKFETYWEDVVSAVERQSEGSPDHFLIGSLITYSIPFPELTAPHARIKVWIEDSDDEFARDVLAWADPIVENARRSAPILGGGMASVKAVEFATFQSIANTARIKLKLPLDKSLLSSEAPPMQDEYGENSWSAFEDLEGRKFDEERAASPPPCDRRTLDRHYQRFLMREWRREQKH